MGWKGALRSVNAELNRQSRAADKRNREELKEQELENAYATVQNQEKFLDEIISLHHEGRANFDWKAIENEIEPQEPLDSNPFTTSAIFERDNFKPNIIDNVLKIKKWRIGRLDRKVNEARILDKNNYDRSVSYYESHKQEWDKKQDLARRLKTDKKALMEALQEYLDIEDLPIGQDVKFEISDDMKLDINLKVFPYEEVIPEEEYSLRQSGKLSVKKMAKNKGVELYQDHVCSALLRVVREIFGVIPIDMLRANAVTNAVNTQTGHLEDQVIVSAIIPRDTLNKLNLRNIDPSNSFYNFVHNMKLQKTKGFTIVQKIEFPQENF